MFDLSPLLDAPAPVQAHVISALAALAATPVVIFRRRRDRLHKTLGYVWASAMALTAASSFLIMEIRLIGPFSPIHILSAVTLVNLVLAISAIRRSPVAGCTRCSSARPRTAPASPRPQASRCWPPCFSGPVGSSFPPVRRCPPNSRDGRAPASGRPGKRNSPIRKIPLHIIRIPRYSARHQAKTVRSWRNW